MSDLLILHPPVSQNLAFIIHGCGERSHLPDDREEGRSSAPQYFLVHRVNAFDLLQIRPTEHERVPACTRHLLHLETVSFDQLTNPTLAQVSSMGDVFQPREVQRKGWTHLTRKEDVEEAIKVLEALDWVSVQSVHTPGRKRTDVLVNPRIKETNDGKMAVTRS
jgi:hypothetical protein